MFQAIPIGTYYPGSSFLHRLRARTKLLVVLWVVIFLTIANHRTWHFLPYLLAFLLIISGIALSRLPFRLFWRRMRIPVLVALIGVIPTMLFPGEDTPKPLFSLGTAHLSNMLVYAALLVYGLIFVLGILLLALPLPALRAMKPRPALRTLVIAQGVLALLLVGILTTIVPVQLTAGTLVIGPVIITYDGVWLEVTLFVVFVVLFSLSLLLTLTTSPIALIEGMTRLMTPLRWLRLPVDDFALMTLIALRFIPTLVEEAELLVKAQMSRGASFSQGSIAERAQSVVALFVPFIQNTLRRASDLAIALEARGYEVDGRQTLLHEGSFQKADYLVMGSVALLTIAALLV